MSITYAVSKVAATFQVSFRAIEPVVGAFQYNTRRGFLRFDTSVVTGGVEAASLILVCATIVGGGDSIQLQSATGASGWGATLDASQPDFASTNVVDEGSQSITTTGTKTFPVDPTSIDLSGTTYLRLRMVTEGAGAPYSKGATFASQNNGTAGNRPILRLTLFTGQVIYVNSF